MTMFRTIRAAAFLAATLLLSQALSSTAEARRVWPGVGAGGGTLSTVECPEDKALVGFTGARGTFIDRLQIVCATLFADGTYGTPEPYGDPVGGAGGVQFPMKVCPRNAKLFDMAIVVSNNLRYLDAVNFHCRDQSGNMSLHMLWETLAENYFQGNGQQTVGLQSCPQENFTGLRIYFRDYVKAVGVVCDGVEITPVAAAKPPPPIKSSVRMPKAPSGPPVARAEAFAGKWQTATNANGHFDIILSLNGPGVFGNGQVVAIPVTGQFVNTDGAHDYDGSLQGTIPPYTRQLHYTYTQTNGAVGTGVFQLSNDGNAITGEGTTGDGTKFTWNGTRAP